MKPETWLETLNCAVEGILHAVHTQRHMRWHSLACLVVLVLAARLPLTPAEFAALCLAAAIVIVAELANTAVESAVDLACDEYHPLARAAKDVAAGAVLVAAFAAAAVGWVVLYPKMRQDGIHLLEVVNQREPVSVAATLLVLLVLVVLLKAWVGRGRPLHGGLPSGHAAVSFAIATLLLLRTKDPMVGVLAGILAVMVSHSRLLHRIHTRTEVALGAAVGTLVAAVLFWLIF